MTSNSTLLTGSKRLLEDQINDNLLVTPIIKKHKSCSEEFDEEDEEFDEEICNSEKQERTVIRKIGPHSIHEDIEKRPTLFISTADSLKRILKFIALTTGTSYFNGITDDKHDFNIESIVHIIHDPSMPKDDMSVTRQRCDDENAKYEITTVKNKVSDMTQELVEQRDGFDAIDRFMNDENRLLVIKANFDKWDIYFNDIVISCHANKESIADLTWEVDFETDKYITVLRSDYDIEYFHTNMEKNFSIESHKSFTERVLVLYPVEYIQEWSIASKEFYEFFSIKDYKLFSHTFISFNEPNMIKAVRNIITMDRNLDTINLD